MISTSTSHRLGVPTMISGKRSRSNSVSSSASSASSSAGGSSIFSHLTSTTSDNLSSCSSPASDDIPSHSTLNDDERPSKSLRTNDITTSSIATEVQEETLTNLSKKCSLNPPQTASESSAQSSNSSLPPQQPIRESNCSGKTLFVDCLVDATVHVLGMIWHAPIRKAVAFLKDQLDVSHVDGDEASEVERKCRCPIGLPLTAGIPMDLFIRETLRRSRTSCSTLQAALLFCKRAGPEVVRKRAELENYAFDEDEAKILDATDRAYPSLSKSIDAETMASLPSGMTADPILCSRRSFLASVMVSSKFLQDRTFSNRAWSKISGLNVKELGLVERRLLDAIEFELAVEEDEWSSWTSYLKGEWKLGKEVCSCKSSSSASSAPQANAESLEYQARKVISRTTSLRLEDVVDMEMPQSSVIMENVSPLATPNAATCEFGASTPTQTLRHVGVQTPTRAGQHRREASLLATAINNNASGAVSQSSMTEMTGVTNSSSTSTSTSNDLPLPFPLRKGLTARSISAR